MADEWRPEELLDERLVRRGRATPGLLDGRSPNAVPVAEIATFSQSQGKPGAPGLSGGIKFWFEVLKEEGDTPAATYTTTKVPLVHSLHLNAGGTPQEEALDYDVSGKTVTINDPTMLRTEDRVWVRYAYLVGNVASGPMFDWEDDVDPELPVRMTAFNYTTRISTIDAGHTIAIDAHFTFVATQSVTASLYTKLRTGTTLQADHSIGVRDYVSQDDRVLSHAFAAGDVWTWDCTVETWWSDSAQVAATMLATSDLWSDLDDDVDSRYSFLSIRLGSYGSTSVWPRTSPELVSVWDYGSGFDGSVTYWLPDG